MLKWLVTGKEEEEEEDTTITDDPLATLNLRKNLATLNLRKNKKRSEIYSVNR